MAGSAASLPSLPFSSALILFLATVAIAQYDTNDKIPDVVPQDEFVTFVSRPDIQVPRWNVTVYDRALVSPGYWFTAPYEQIGADVPNPAWVGPTIFDQNGDLVWSSGDMFDGANIFDFRMAMMDGRQWMTLISTFTQSVYLIDEHYQIAHQQPVVAKGQASAVNMHDFNLVGDGTRALVLHRNFTDAPAASIEGLSREGKCRVMSQGFYAMDTTGDEWETVFSWHALDHIGVNESTKGPVCKGLWDFLHTNSVDQCPDGHYVLSGRHTDAIYKIHNETGEIIWRLGGLQSDFQSDFQFSRQHNIRCPSQNETHTVVTFLDNAKGADKQAGTNPWSRGLIVSLETGGDQIAPRKASIMGEFAHPFRKYNTGRGNCELLADGNVWMGWSDRSLQSEHTPDGTMVMQAELVPEWLRSYRSYKFPFTGQPTRAPDVVAAASSARRSGGTTTRVHVSWNGATEVAYWNLYKSDASGAVTLLVASAPRRGFETELVYNGFASYVVAEALDASGRVLAHGRSVAVKTAPAARLQDEAVADEAQWQQQAAFHKEHPWQAAAHSAAVRTRGSAVALFAMGLLSGFALALAARLARRLYGTMLRRLGIRRYDPVADDEAGGPHEKSFHDSSEKVFDLEDEDDSSFDEDSKTPDQCVTPVPH